MDIFSQVVAWSLAAFGVGTVVAALYIILTGGV